MNIVKKGGIAAYCIGILVMSVGILRAADVEKSVKMKDIPAAVQKTISEQSKGAKVRGLAMEVKDGKTYYEVELNTKGHKKDILIDETGAIAEVEEKVELSALPAAVRAQLLASAGKGKIKSVEALTKTGEPTIYEALVKTAGKESEIKVSSDGKVIEEKVKKEIKENHKGKGNEVKEENEKEEKGQVEEKEVD